MPVSVIYLVLWSETFHVHHITAAVAAAGMIDDYCRKIIFRCVQSVSGAALGAHRIIGLAGASVV